MFASLFATARKLVALGFAFSIHVAKLVFFFLYSFLLDIYNKFSNFFFTDLPTYVKTHPYTFSDLGRDTYNLCRQISYGIGYVNDRTILPFLRFLSDAISFYPNLIARYWHEFWYHVDHSMHPRKRPFFYFYPKQYDAFNRFLVKKAKKAAHYRPTKPRHETLKELDTWTRDWKSVEAHLRKWLRAPSSDYALPREQTPKDYFYFNSRGHTRTSVSPQFIRDKFNPRAKNFVTQFPPNPPDPKGPYSMHFRTFRFFFKKYPDLSLEDFFIHMHSRPAAWRHYLDNRGIYNLYYALHIERRNLSVRINDLLLNDNNYLYHHTAGPISYTKDQYHDYFLDGRFFEDVMAGNFVVSYYQTIRLVGLLSIPLLYVLFYFLEAKGWVGPYYWQLELELNPEYQFEGDTHENPPRFSIAWFYNYPTYDEYDYLDIVRPRRFEIFLTTTQSRGLFFAGEVE